MSVDFSKDRKGLVIAYIHIQKNKRSHPKIFIYWIYSYRKLLFIQKLIQRYCLKNQIIFPPFLLTHDKHNIDRSTWYISGCKIKNHIGMNKIKKEKRNLNLLKRSSKILALLTKRGGGYYIMFVCFFVWLFGFFSFKK